MKIAIVSTPRSGNTWLRYMLSQLYGLTQHAVHTPQALNWGSLSINSIVQLHWHRWPEFETMLAEHGFRSVTIARHPIAVLVSIWQFAPHEPQTAQWLSGEGGTEVLILNKPINSLDFLEYACGPRARALLSVSAEWWDVPGGVQVRYEDLVRIPQTTLTSLCSILGPPKQSIDSTLRDNTFEKLQPTASNHHFWQGQAEAWRQLVPQEFAQEIELTHIDVFKHLGYSC